MCAIQSHPQSTYAAQLPKTWICTQAPAEIVPLKNLMTTITSFGYVHLFSNFGEKWHSKPVIGHNISLSPQICIAEELSVTTWSLQLHNMTLNQLTIAKKSILLNWKNMGKKWPYHNRLPYSSTSHLKNSLSGINQEIS